MFFILIHRHWQLFGGGIRKKWMLFHILSNIVLNNVRLVENRTKYLIQEYTLKNKAKCCSFHVSGMCKNLIGKVSCEDCLWVAWPGCPLLLAGFPRFGWLCSPDQCMIGTSLVACSLSTLFIF